MKPGVNESVIVFVFGRPHVLSDGSVPLLLDGREVALVGLRLTEDGTWNASVRPADQPSATADAVRISGLQLVPAAEEGAVLPPPLPFADFVPAGEAEEAIFEPTALVRLVGSLLARCRWMLVAGVPCGERVWTVRRRRQCPRGIPNCPVLTREGEP